PNGYHALEFAVAHGDEIFPQTPVVFSTVLETQLKHLKLKQNFTGSLLQIDYRGLLNTALNNHPDTRHVAIIVGTSKTGRMFEAQIRPAYAPYANKYDFIYLGHPPMSDMLDRLSKLPKHTVVLYFYLSKDGKGEAFKPWKVAGMVSDAANSPVYGISDTYLGSGIVGGALLSIKEIGRKTGEIGLRILNGENPADIPISAEGTILNMFDWRQLKRWGINESDLPEGSIVRYKEWSFWDLYRWYIIGGIILFFLQGLFIVSLAVQRKRGRQREQRLRASEDRYSAFVKNSTEGIFRIEFDTDIYLDMPEDEQLDLVFKHGYIAETNDVHARTFGLEHAEELEGVRIEELLSRSDPQNVATIKAWIQGHYNIVDAETVESYKDGSTRYFLNNTVSTIEAGRVVRVWCTYTEITERKTAENKLREAEQKYRTVADFTYDWEYWRTPDDRMLYVSPSCERITGYRPSDFMDRPELIESLILPEDLAAWYAHSHNVKLGRVKGNCQYRIRAKDGTARWIDHICRPVYDRQGNYIGARASNRDITELKRTEQEASENREALARLDRTVTLGQLAGSIAHELNQPLTGILSNAQAGEMLLKQGDRNSTEIDEILTDIIADSKRSGDILRNLRDLFSRQKSELKPLGVNGTVKETLRLLRSEFVIRGLNIRLDLSDGLPDVMGNRIQLQQVLINLINNARQSMQQSAKADRSISIITSRGNESEVQVHVEDAGPGIDQEQIEGIFDPLTTLKPDGLGMGLSICRSIVQAHGGRIWAENRPAGGARISFTLPAVERKL
ncbi:PAS domain S-box protein, partial [bacterium]|nr:PAS domain S-box protein [bacterium]